MRKYSRREKRQKDKKIQEEKHDRESIRKSNIYIIGALERENQENRRVRNQRDNSRKFAITKNISLHNKQKYAHIMRITAKRYTDRSPVNAS